MNSDFLGGGLVFAIAATLWIVYLIPTWLRRHTFDVTERNAVRLQQTIRALAETTELPTELRVEASARAVAEQKRVLREAQTQARLRLRAATAAAIGYDDAGVRARARRRGQRLMASVVLLGSIIGIGLGTSLLLTQQGWQVLAVSCLIFAVAIVVQNEISGPVTSTAAGRVSSGVAGQASADYASAATQTASRLWTPTALPKPMHLSQGSIAAAVIQSQEAAERLRLAAAESALIERLRAAGGFTGGVTGGAASSLRGSAPVPLRVSPPAVPSVDGRFARMGIVDDASSGQIDLDAALRRRRATA